MKRAAAFALAVILCLSVLPLTCFADDERPTAKLFALTFDDGPDGNYTDQLLDGLALRPQAKVTFFFLGCYAERYPDDVLYAWHMGHQIGSHTYDHSALGNMSWSQSILEERDKTESVVCALTGQANHLWIRPPYGSINSTAVNCLERPIIIWDSDPGDWKGYSADTLYQNICNDAGDGVISGLHCTHDTTVQATLAAVDTLTDRGYEFVTVQELLWLRGITVSDGSKYYDAEPEGDNYIVNWGWFDEDAGRCWFSRNGWRHYGWLHTGGKTYYMDSQTAFMCTGWQYIDGAWYNLGEDGVLRATVSDLSFSDVAPDSPSYRSIRRCCRSGLMEPAQNGSFAPQDAVSSQDLVMALWKLAGRPEGDPNRWAADHDLLPEEDSVTRDGVLAAFEKVAGMAGGDRSDLMQELNGALDIDEAYVTRAETATLLVRLKDYLART